jgi:hypothetical protein
MWWWVALTSVANSSVLGNVMLAPIGVIKLMGSVVWPPSSRMLGYFIIKVPSLHIDGGTF